MAAGCAADPAPATKPERTPLRDDQEIALGRAVTPVLEQWLGGPYRDPKLEVLLSSVGAAVAARSGRPHLPYTFRVVDASAPGAFALPGGTVLVTRGLLARIDGADELAAVLAHEVAHIAARHLEARVTPDVVPFSAAPPKAAAPPAAAPSSAGPAAAAAAALSSSGPASSAAAARPLEEPLSPAALSRIIRRVALAKHTAAEEREARELGSRYAAEAGFDARGAAVLDRFRTGPGCASFAGGSVGSGPSFADMHPSGGAGAVAAADEAPAAVTTSSASIPAASGPGGSGAADQGAAVETALLRLREVEPAYAEYDRGAELYGQGKFVEARAACERAIALSPQRAPFYAALGETLLALDVTSKAVDAFLTAIPLDAELYAARLGAGKAYLADERWREADRQLERARSLLPVAAEPAFYLGVSAEAQGDAARAAGAYASAVELAPEGSEVGREAGQRLAALRSR